MKPRAEQCDCKQAHHSHGERVTYVIHECRCRACQDAAAYYERERVKQVAYGRDNLTDAEPVRDHIRALQDQGMGYARIAKAAGLHSSYVGAILYGKQAPGHPDYRPPRKRMERDRAERIMAITYHHSDGTLVSALGARRRLQALGLMGYSQSHLARLLGGETYNVTLIVKGERQQITYGTHKAIVDVYERLWDTPATGRPSVIARVKNHARAQGWVPAAAWDDIDSALERPKGVTAA